MKNNKLKILVPLLFTFHAVAQIPKLHDLSNWKNLTEEQREETGAFFLFQGWAKDGLIGPKAGVCVNYTPGNAQDGTKAKISFGVNEFYETNQTTSSKSAAIQQNLGKVMSAFKKFLDKGCKDEACKQRKVTLRGFADAQRNLNPEDHEFAKKFEAKYGDITKYSGKLSPADLSSLGLKTEVSKPTNPSLPSSDSPKANSVLALRRAMRYAGPAAQFSDNISVEGRASLQGEKIRDAQGANAQGVNCQARRQAVIDVEFVPPKISGNEKKGELGLDLKVTSKQFLDDMTMSGALQVALAMDKLGMGRENLNDKDQDKIDKVIEEVLKAQNITDPKTLTACKNYGTRAFVMDSSRRVGGYGPQLKSLIKQEGGIQNLLTKFKSANNQPFANSGPLEEVREAIKKDGGIVKLDDKSHSLLTQDGFSTSVMDCFSSKEVVAANLSTDNELKQQLCKSPAEYAKGNTLNLTLNTNTQGRHTVGCKGCDTGHTFEPTADGKKKPITLDRFYGLRPANSRTAKDLTDHRPYSSDEIVEFSQDMQKLSEIIKTIKPENKEVHPRTIAEYGNSIAGAGYNNLNGRSDYNKFETYLDKHLSAEGKALWEKRKEFLKRYNNSTLTKDTAYVRAKWKSIHDPKDMTDSQKKDLEYYENVLYPGVSAQKHLKEAHDTNLTFGGLKNVSYYVVENCNCATSPVVDMISQGQGVKKVTITSDPMKEVQNLKDPNNTCIFVPPVPASCNYAPTEQPIDTASKKGGADTLNWINAAGDSIEKTVDEVIKDIDQTNSELALSFGQCSGKDYKDRANELLQNVACNKAATLPTNDEAVDCGYKSKVSQH